MAQGTAGRALYALLNNPMHVPSSGGGGGAAAAIASDEVFWAKVEWASLAPTNYYDLVAGKLVRRDRELLQHDHFTVWGSTAIL